MRVLLERLQAIALLHGAHLQHPSSLRALSIERNARKGDFSRGVLAAVAEVYLVACQSPEGRQAVRDLGFQPILEKVEGE